MIKNETQIIQKEKNPLLNSISDKENKNEENIKEIKSDNFNSIYNKLNERKYFLMNNNTIPENTLENQTTANKKASNDNILLISKIKIIICYIFQLLFKIFFEILSVCI